MHGVVTGWRGRDDCFGSGVGLTQGLKLPYTGGIESCFRGDHPEYIETTEKMM